MPAPLAEPLLATPASPPREPVLLERVATTFFRPRVMASTRVTPDPGAPQLREQCVICFDRDADCVYQPCGHGGVCEECARRAIQASPLCHMCRGRIESVAKITATGVDDEGALVAVGTVIN